MNDLVFYMDRLTLLAFFSGYPVVYMIILILANIKKEPVNFLKKLVKLLPFAYAFTATLFLGLLLKDFYSAYTHGIADQILFPFIKIWGIMGVLFWLPSLNSRPVFSLLHSLLFFFLLVKNIFLYTFSIMDREILRNDMKMYSDSLILNAAAMALIAVVYFLFTALYHKRKAGVI